MRLHRSQASEFNNKRTRNPEDTARKKEKGQTVFVFWMGLKNSPYFGKKIQAEIEWGKFS